MAILVVGGEEKGRCRVAAAWVRWLVVAKRETQARRKDGLR